ncbi:uncharacterized protein ACBT57_014140 [Dama dama]
MDSRAVEAQTLMTAVGQILKERMVFHQGPHATELNWYQAEFQGPRASKGTKGKKQEQQEKWRFERSSPHSPWRPAIPGLVHSSSPGSALAWWQEAATAWSFSTSTHLESQKESLPLYPPEASFWEDPRNRQGEAGGLAFVNPNVQELLEILITKRVELKSWEEKEKDEEAGYHLNSLGKRIESLGHKQDTLGHQHFGNITGKHDQLLGPEKPQYPDTLGGCLQKTCSQLFWGLPFLHSESLIAAVIVPGSALELCPVLFNERSKAKAFHIPAKVTAQLSLAKHLTQPVAQAQPQSLTPTMPQLQPSPLGHMETQAQPLPLTPIMPQCQPSSEVSLETQSSSQIVASTMPHSLPPTRAHMEAQARPQLLVPTMPHFQPPPQTHMETQARPPPRTPLTPQFQPSPRAHMETQKIYSLRHSLVSLSLKGSLTSRLRLKAELPACSFKTVKLEYSFKTVPPICGWDKIGEVHHPPPAFLLL